MISFTKINARIKYFILFQLLYNSSFAIIPFPDHVVILVLENHSYNQIVGSSAAPYLNGLINDNKAALFTESYGLSHPSQPNYIQLFSGSNQNVTDNNIPAGLPFTTPNLGADLLANGKTFIGYSEDLPSVGYTGEYNGAYARKHNPWVNWQGASANGIPSSLNQPFTSFPSNYNLLPTVSFVVPNQDNDMHNGGDPISISIGDAWTQTNLDGYIQWAKENNSLCIITFDEDDYFSNQHVYTLFIGEMVSHGNYNNHIDHYNILRLIEDIYTLPKNGAAATALPIDYCWKSCSQPASISSSGPLTFCQGNSVILTASNGSSYLWSNGTTTKSITVTTSGNFSVLITDSIGCISNTSPLTVTVNSFKSDGIIFNETMGTVLVDKTIVLHESENGFDNDNLTFSGSGEIRASSPSSGYSGASAGGNIYLTKTIGTSAIISNINSTSLSNLQLSFGIYKSTTAGNGSDLFVQVSNDGITYTTLSYPALPTGSGTAVWHYRTATGIIPSTSNLRIRFLQNGTATFYRIDDVVLKYSNTTPIITASGPTTFCNGGSVVLTASLSNSYAWSNNVTTQNITVNSSEKYFVIATGTNGCTATSNTITVIAASPTINSFTPSQGPVGSYFTINGSGFTGTTSVKLNGVEMSSFSLLSNTQITAVVPAGASSGTITVTNICGNGNSASVFTVLSGTPMLNITLFIEGYYLGGGQMISVLGAGICDTVTLELHNNLSPFNLIYSVKSTINTIGNGTFILPGSVYNTNCYVAASTRNSIKAWSAMPLFIDMNSNYNFSTTTTNTFGNQIKNLGDGKFALYSGDVNQDGQISIDDFNLIRNATQLFTSGYLTVDLTGDNLIESSDFSLMENNKIPILEMHP